MTESQGLQIKVRSASYSVVQSVRVFINLLNHADLLLGEPV